jgi:DNA-binding PadR family transcriptional regulator
MTSPSETAEGASSASPKSEALPLTGWATLGLLSPNERFTPVEIQERAYQQLRHFYWAPALSHIRRELNRLDDLGYVNALVVEQGRIKRTLKYSITEAGTRALAEWAERPEADTLVVKNAVILRLWLGRRAENSRAVLHALEAHMDVIESELAALVGQMEGAENRFKEKLLALEGFDSDGADIQVLANRTAWHRAVMRYCRRNYENELANSAELLKELTAVAHRDA